MKTLFQVLLLLTVSVASYAQDRDNHERKGGPNCPPPVLMGGSEQVEPDLELTRGDYQEVQIATPNINGYVNKVIIVTKGNAKIEVLANGKSKGFIDSEAWRKTSTTIIIDDYASSIGFRHAGGRKVTIKRIVTLPLPTGCCSFLYPKADCVGVVTTIPCTPGETGYEPCGGNVLRALQQMEFLYKAFLQHATATDLEASLGPVLREVSDALSIGRQGRGQRFLDQEKKVIIAYDASKAWAQNIGLMGGNARRLVDTWMADAEMVRRDTNQ